MPEDDPSPGPEKGGGIPSPPQTEGDVPEGTSEALAAALESPGADSAAELHEKRARLAEARLEEVLAAYRQLKVDNDGYRDRTTRNLERRYDQRRERLLLKFIEILDNLDRALEAAEQTYAGAPLIEGLILVRTRLLQTLQEEGLERIPVLGLPYDPNFSEAVGTQPVEDPDHHHVVVKELLRGYRLNGRIARASRVVVGEHPGGAEATKAQQAAPADPSTVQSPPEAGPSLDEIVERTQAQEASFPGAFDPEEE